MHAIKRRGICGLLLVFYFASLLVKSQFNAGGYTSCARTACVTKTERFTPIQVADKLDQLPSSISERCVDRFQEKLLPPVSTFRKGVQSVAEEVQKCLERHAVVVCYEQIPGFRNLTISERELISWLTGTPPFYYGPEADSVREVEATAALRALPPGVPASRLNVIDIGAGGRAVNKHFLPVEPHRVEQLQLPTDQKPYGVPLLGWAENLPFAQSSLDAILSLHNLEHLENPVNFLLDALDVLKPGGGVGIIIPNVFFCWDPAGDDHAWGHRWATDPVSMCKLYHTFLEPYADLEHIATYNERISFDFVLRKKREHMVFDDQEPTYSTGKEKMCKGERWHGDRHALVWQRANEIAERNNVSINRRRIPASIQCSQSL